MVFRTLARNHSQVMGCWGGRWWRKLYLLDGHETGKLGHCIASGDCVLFLTG